MTGIEKLKKSLQKETSSAPLVFFRFAFGIMMFISLVRFAANGWVDVLYVQPKFFFPFYGFEFIKPLGATVMYVVFGVMMLASLLVALGKLYRLSIITFFLLFTYVELIDKSNYLNHYYFISIISFMLCILPAPTKGAVPRWVILTLQLQMAIVYFFAGIAKINPDWLLHAMPLKIWLASKSDLPFIGSLLTEDWIAYVFSWCGMLFDVCIAFFLFNHRTVWYAYIVVVVFHLLTAILFPMIGMFPFIMIVAATIFLPAAFHNMLIRLSNFKLPIANLHSQSSILNFQFFILPILCVHFLIQIFLPLRSHLYDGELFWHEQGYRFSWRVMLMEKAGMVFFTVKNEDGKLFEVNSRNFLTMQQEKQMSTQPDMILQFAHHLQKVYKTSEVYAEAYVCVNGRSSQLFIDPRQNLCEVEDGFENKEWVTSPQPLSEGEGLTASLR
ncbi:MAG: HTTM domain-containing protein [Bacteroidetes bacterium]|nr:HTTM domain-containing protein [Bacteroidota bacterium]